MKVYHTSRPQLLGFERILLSAETALPPKPFGESETPYRLRAVIYTQTRIGFMLFDDAVVAFNKVGKDGFSASRLKTAVFVHVHRKELLQIPHFHPIADASILKEVASRRHAIRNRHDNRIEAMLEIGGAFFDQQIRRSRRAMNGSVLQDEEASTSLTRTVSAR